MALSTIEPIFVGGHKDSLTFALLHFTKLLDFGDGSVLVHREVREGSKFDVLVDVFLSLGSGVDLLLFLLTSDDFGENVEVHHAGFLGDLERGVESLAARE